MPTDSNRPPSSLPATVLEALQRGNLIEAIKLLRSSGFGLKEAKDGIEAHLKGAAPSNVKSAPDFSGIQSGTLPPAVIQALQRGNKIEAIKLLRDQTELGLMEAKQAVDVYERSHLRPASGLSPGQVPNSAGGIWWVVVVVVCVAGWYVLRRMG